MKENHLKNKQELNKTRIKIVMKCQFKHKTILNILYYNSANENIETASLDLHIDYKKLER
jgi:hypothetical protein